MGILNLTPDSFYAGGRITGVEDAIRKAGQMLEDGADILDLGAVSTRPGAPAVSEEEEKSRLIPSLKAIAQRYPEAIISVDTFRSEVAREAVTSGASLINDISGGTLDPKMFDTIAELQVPYVLMHIQGTPETMQTDPQYGDVTREVIRWLADRIYALRQQGVNDILADPGFGFGKTVTHNYTLLKELEYFAILDVPLLVGLSRKSMIYKSLNIKPEESLTGTIALNYHALMKGAKILRVHDVKEAAETIGVFELANGNERPNFLL